MGEVRVPAWRSALAHTQRAPVQNFPIPRHPDRAPAYSARWPPIKGAAADRQCDCGRPAPRRSPTRSPGRRTVAQATSPALPDRRLPDRLRHLDQHEHERVIASLATESLGKNCTRTTTSCVAATNDVFPSSIHVAATGASPRPDPGPGSSELSLAPRQSCRCREVRAHPPDGRDPVPWARSSAATRPRSSTASSNSGPPAASGAAVGRHRRRHRHQHPARVCRRGDRATGRRHGPAAHRGRNHFEAQAPATGWWRHPASCGPSPWPVQDRQRPALDGLGPDTGLGESACPTSSPVARSCPARSTRCSPRRPSMVCAQVIGNDATLAFAGTTGTSSST